MSMKVLSVLSEKDRDAFHARPATIAFLGDSVTNGCFEVYPDEGGNGGIHVVFDEAHSYSADVGKILRTLYPHGQLNIINAGISGDSAPGGLERLSRDVLPYHPDLTVVCYGLNDSGMGDAGIERYHAALVGIISLLKEAGSEVILMTPQPIATRVHSQLRGGFLRDAAAGLAKSYAEGGFDRYMDSARLAAKETGVPLCDCYAKWKCLEANGVDVTDHLANYLNHPTREMHWLFAYSLVETMFSAE